MFSNQTLAVWFYLFLAIPTLFTGWMIATTPRRPAGRATR